MNNTRQSASNGFAQGLIMDYHESGMPNSSLTNALNATFITYNGNEAILQNDLGNGRVETASLPEGFVPLGTTSFGGIIYIVSYNPLQDMCQIGSFPSPERNFIEGEDNSGYFSMDLSTINNNTSTNFQIVIPLVNNSGEEIKLSTGDKFAMYLPDLNKYYHYIEDISMNGDISKKSPSVKLVLGIRREGQLRELTDLLRHSSLIGDNSYSYTTFSKSANDPNHKNDDEFKKTLESYRNLIESPYNIVNCNISGTLCLIIKIITLDTFNEQHKIIFNEDI